jgi:xylan 1,4-beta-xylosidase
MSMPESGRRNIKNAAGVRFPSAPARERWRLAGEFRLCRRDAGAPGFMSLFAAIVLLAALSPLRAETAAPPPAHKVRIVLVGDSTVTDSAGWGLGFKQLLSDRAECINTAMGGRSSLSFRSEGRWTNALALQGDYYLIQFGHNNEPGKPGRSTDMPTFVSNMVSYVEEARAIGAQPVLVTPLVRRQWDKDHPGKIKSSLAPYAAEVRKIAAGMNVPLVDLHDRSRELCESLGREKCYPFSPLKTVEGTNTFDGTHLTASGSVLFARLVTDELRKAVPALAPVFQADAAGTSARAAPGEVPLGALLRAGESKSYPHTGEPPMPPGLKPLFDVRMRDPSICRGPDGMYYLTGTTGTNIWVANEGIEIWKSPDLKNWAPLGMVWSIERDGTWQKTWTVKNGNRRRAVWAPEIHWLKGNFYIAYCVTGLGTGLLRSTTGRAEGPYASVNQPDAPLTPGIDASLFEDDDGKVYFVYGSGYLARLKDDLSGLAEGPVRLRCVPADTDIEHHHPQRPCASSELDHVGFEGAFLFKANGLYYLSCAERYYERYHCMTAESETLRGPYRARYVSVPEAGHNVFFRDQQGAWWSTIFGNDDDAPFRERPGILRVEFDPNGHLRPLVPPLKKNGR